ncbi:MAG: amidohydrolase [Kineosporiaceae bacterium]|nr:amidohydrolase [Kineosporiaceae bacterium]
MPLIDARVRLPQDRRPDATYTMTGRAAESYDRVLNLTEKMNTGTLAALLAALDGAGVRQAVMHAESEGGESADALNAALVRVIAEHPDRLVGVGTVDLAPARPRRACAQVDAAAREGLLGICLEPAFFGLDIDDRLLYPVYARAEEQGLVVAVHTGINYARTHPIRHERPELLDQVAVDFPDLRLIAAHAGWPWATEFAAVARRHPTVYLEFGGLAPKYVTRAGTGWDVVFAMMPNLLRSQVLHATDWPVIEPGRALAEWRAAGLDVATLDALLGGNAATLFGLDRPRLAGADDWFGHA